MDFGSLMAFYTFLLGLALGSFMNVCIYRIPQKRSIIRPPSSCTQCGEKIKSYDNIPIISFLVLRGKCRNCAYPISWRYPAVELMTGLLSLSLFIRYGITYQYLLYLLFVMSLVTISFIDLHHKIIPDMLSLPGIVLGLICSFFLPTISWLDSVLGIIGGGGVLFVVGFGYERLTGKEGMGGGDVKLLAMIGAWMGWRPLPFVLLMASFIGAVIGIIFILFSGKGLRVRIPFGPFLSLGALLYLFFGEVIMHWYYNLLL